MKNEAPIQIDLKVPRSWNECTTEQLELVAAVIMKHTNSQDRYHPFDWTMVKTELFFVLTGVEIVRHDRESEVTTCRYDGFEFELEPWQILSWCDQLLKWVDDPKQTRLIFPYKELLPYVRPTMRYWCGMKLPWLEKCYHTPQELLQDFKWHQYRYLQDYMDEYIRLSNHIVKMQQGVVDKDRLKELNAQQREARNEFLAVLFHCEKCQHRVRAINDVQWQVILFWWGGMMHYLQKTYPHCFKGGGKKQKKQRQPNPLELYTSIIATMQVKTGLDEEKVNNQTFHIVLEQLERIAKEAEEMEKMNKKK